MTKFLLTASAVALSATSAFAGGIDRSGQGLGILFEKGRVVELSFGYVSPDLTGRDIAAFGAGSTGDVAGSYTQLGFSYKYDINEKLSFAAILDEPFGADILYGASSVALGRTRVDATSYALTGLLRYKFNENFSVHGGVRAQQAEAGIDLRGRAYGPLNGYSVNLSSDWGLGYVVGVAYERPDIALRVALTYNSEVKHEFDTVETGLVGPAAALNGVITQTDVSTPQSVNLDFQTGIAKDTLVFGQIRYVDWSELTLSPRGFAALTSGASLIDIKDTTTFTLGVGRRFNENWSGSISFQYENRNDVLVSPLGPSNGRKGVTLAAVYTQDNIKVTTGINYTELGDVSAETGTPDVARSNFNDSKSVGIGVRVAYTF
jgi:long-chain fatty acid transport protein